MMSRILSLMFFVLSPFVVFSQPQGDRIAPDYKSIVAQEPLKTKCSVQLNEKESLPVDIVFSPRRPDRYALFFFYAPQSVNLSARILNSDGVEVFSWVLKEPLHSIEETWDLKELPSGQKYQILIYTVGQEAPIGNLFFKKK